ncbi:hypothetical protein DL771_005115 [Monosporascus sp. 5C6A]|nr:hypothetical protein DL771_005115 [Monosporascus sp. 5C6A]
MEPVFVNQRQRKFHRRSKRGCLICSYCLKHGAECRYSDSDASPSPIGTPRHTDPGSDAGEPNASLLDPSPKDPFTGTSFKLPDKSRDLFNLLQTIRFVNEQIKDPVTATHDGTVAAVATLALVEVPMQKGQYSQPLWFWSVMFGACITTVGKTDSSLEEAQMKLARDEYLDKINMASQVLGIKTWEDAKSALRLFAWEDEFDGELELKAIWEEAIWADQGRAKRPGTGNVDSRDVRAFW